MATKSYRPYTPSRRFMTGYDFSNITQTTPHKKLTTFVGATAWRNNAGRITTRHRWGWHKRLYRIIDFRRYDKENIPARVETIEYDPYRTTRIVLVCYADWERRYHLARKWVKVGDKIMTWSEALLKPWSTKRLKDIPDWFAIYNLELTPQTKWKIIRSAGQSATITWRDEEKKIVYVKLPSTEIRMFHENCWATIWTLSNDEHKNIVLGKAWRSRWLGRRPEVRGKAMNPVDHPHGWWEWSTDIALKYPKSFRGKPVAPGMKTRKKKKWSDKLIVSRRKSRFK